LAFSTARADPVRVTIVSARIDPKKASGPARTTTALSDLTCLSEPGLRPMAGKCGGASRDPDAPAIDPMVVLELGSTRTVRTYPLLGTLTPQWDYAFVIDPDRTDDTEAPVFGLYDFAGGKELRVGTRSVKFKELFALGTHTVKGVAGQSEITWRVEALPKEAAPRRYQYRVPADQQMADLARSGSEGASGGRYALVPVAEGEAVEILAVGSVQPSFQKRPDIVSGPNGLPTIASKIQYNQPGFRNCAGCNHAALIAQLGTKAFVVGEAKRFTAQSAGYLLLGINDLKVDDNAGGYQVTVTVTPPVAEPDGVDPRVMEQALDAHSAAIEACVAAEPNPAGRIVFLFAIAADGRPIGVSTTECTDNLRRAADCVIAQASKWSFPASGAVVSFSYPLTFQVE
jgi:hypothetical protein